MFICHAWDSKYPFWANLVQKNSHFIRNENLVQVFSQFLKKIFKLVFVEHLRTAAFGIYAARFSLANIWQLKKQKLF